MKCVRFPQEGGRLFFCTSNLTIVMKGLKIAVSAIAMAMIFGASAKGAETVSLGVDEAVAMAQENNLSLKAARSRVDQAEGRYLQTRKSYLPTVSLSETVMHTNDPAAVFTWKLRQGVIGQQDMQFATMNDPDAVTNFQAGISLQQPVFNKDAWKGRSAARAVRESMVHQYERAGQSIGLEVKKAYYGLVLARLNLDALATSIAAMRRHNHEASKAYEKGLVTRSDMLATGVRLAELEEQKLVLLDQEQTMTDALAFFLRLEGDIVIETKDGLDRTGSVTAVLADGAPVDTRSDIMALKAAKDAAEFQYEMAEAKSLPRVNAFAETTWNDDSFPGIDGHNWTLGLSMHWTIFDGYANAGRKAEARAAGMESGYLYEEARERSRFEVRRAARNLATAASRIDVASSALEEARVSLDFISDRYRAGQAMMFELLGREGAYTQAMMRLNKAKFDYVLASSELLYYANPN